MQRYVRPVSHKDLLQKITDKEAEIKALRKDVREISISMGKEEADAWIKAVAHITKEKFGRILDETRLSRLKVIGKDIFRFDFRDIKSPTGPNRTEELIDEIAHGKFDDKSNK